MSLEYELRIVTDYKPAEILTLLSRELQLNWQDSRLIGPGIVLGASPETDRGQSIAQEKFGFQPTVDVWFWLDSQENYQRGKQILLEASLLVLTHLTGDAVLLFNYEYTVLQRIAGTLIFNQKIPLASKEEIAKFDRRFYIQPLRSPLLSDRRPKIEVHNQVYPHLKAIATARGQSMTELANEAIAAYLNGITNPEVISCPESQP